MNTTPVPSSVSELVPPSNPPDVPQGRRPGLRGLLSLLLACAMPIPPAAAAWQWQMPPVLVNLQSTKRNHVFYVGEPVAFKLSAPGASRYVIRDYYGNTVEQGVLSGTVLTPSVKEPGWYKVYLHGPNQGMPWGDSVGSTMFSILRDDPNFPRMPVPGTFGGEGLVDEVTRGVMGYGPQRHKVDNASAADSEIPRLERELGIDQKYYLPYDPVRKRDLLVVFPNGTWDLNGVRKIVERFKGVVKYWEPRNEPNFSTNATSFVNNELKPFYELIKSIDPSLKVIAPGAVTVGPPMAGWNEEFFRAGGARYIDAFSFHAYNCVNGDLNLTRQSLNQVDSWLRQYNATHLEKWQTEQGFLGPVYGAYQPRMQGRWTMLQMMVYEQYRIPKEHNHYWYDRNGGFWDEPRWVQNEDGSLNPVAPLLRVWSEELYGTNFARSYDFGDPGNKMFVGSLFNGPGKQVAAFMTSGDTQGMLELLVTGTDSVKTVSPFGVERTMPVRNGKLLLPVSELPSYVEFTGTLEVSRVDWGQNLARQTGVSAAASGSTVHPIDPSINNAIGKVFNGQLDTWYWTQARDARIWESNNATYPAWFELRLPSAQQIDRVVIYAGIPWQWDGSILDYELQVEQGGQWVTIERVTEPVNTLRAFTQTNRTTVDSFYSERCVFAHSFAPLTTQKIRLWVHDVTWGGASNKDLKDAGAQGGEHQLNLREIEVYRSGAAVPANAAPLAVNDAATCFRDGRVSIPVLANDTDPDAAPYPLTISRVSSPTRGTASVQDGQIVYKPAPGLSGTDTFTYTITDGHKTATATVRVDVSSEAQPLSADTNGLFAEYFNNADFTAPAFTRVDPYVDGNWGTNAPDPAVDAGSFSIRWTGQVQPKTSGTVTFYTTSDDGVRLWVDGKLLIDHWSPHAAWVDQGTLEMQAGRKVDIKLEYFQGGGGAQIALEWSGSGLPREVIPFGSLSLGRAVTLTPPANKPPVAGADTAWTLRDTETVISVLNNDSDADRSPLPIAVQSITSPANGTVALIANQVRYTPKAGFSGTDTFQYTLSDGSATATGTVTVTVAAPDPTRWNGLKAQYFGAADLTLPVLTRLDAGIDFDWGQGSPAAGIGSDGFSVRWSGQVMPRFTERYTFYATSDDGIRMWVNGQMIAQNWSDHAPAEVSGGVDLVAGRAADIVVEYYERTGGAVAQLQWQSASQPRGVVPASLLSTAPFDGGTPPPPPPPPVTQNQVPVAAGDSAVTSEGQAVEIAVLANDSDPDSGPAALSISAVTQAARGSVALVSGKVRYTPVTGFVGLDQFTYTVSDGAATATGTVSVRVNSTALAADLSGAGLGTQAVGNATGSSRILADGSWELNAVGVGAGGTADALRMEAQTLSGDFRARVRMRSVTASGASGAAARVGVMVRESAQPGARAVFLAATPANTLRAGARTTPDSVLVETAVDPAQAASVMPDQWLALERQGEVIRLSVSSDGQQYRPVAQYTLAALPESIQVGLFAASGSGTDPVRAVVSDWLVSRAIPVVQASQQGLLATVFAQSNLTAPVVARVDEQVDFEWGAGSPHPLVAGDNFSVRWEGQIVAPTSERYTFFTRSDDGVRLWVDGQLLVNNWTQHAVTENSGSLLLQAGKPVSIRIEYFEAGRDAVCKLLWSSPGVAKQIVPAAALRPAFSVVPVGTAATAQQTVLADGTREFTALGAGIRAGAADQLGFLGQQRSGNFQNAVRVRSLSGGAGAGSTGLFLGIREGLGTTDRFAAVRLGADGALSVWSRSTAGGAVVSTPVSGSVVSPDAWLLVERRADQVVLAVSSDDLAYRTVGTFELPALSPLVQTGVMLESKSLTLPAKAVLADFEVNPVSEPGLTGHYFSGVSLTGMRLARTDSTVDFEWGTGSPHTRLAADFYSARWTGQVKLPASGPVTFTTESDDGVRLWVNGQLVINNWSDHPRTENSGVVSLRLGQWVDVRLEYYEKAKDAVIRLSWEYPGQPRQVIPAAAFRTEK